MAASLGALYLVEAPGPRNPPFWSEVIPLLRRSGIEPIVGTVVQRTDFHRRLESLGCERFSLDCRSSRDYLPAAVRLGRLVRDRNIGVVQGIEAIPASIVGLAGLLARQSVRIFHRQHMWHSIRSQTILSRIASKTCQVTLACSHAAAECARRLDHVHPSRIFVAYNGVSDLRRVEGGELMALRKELGIEPGAAVISVVSRLRAVKGLNVLLDAVPQVATSIRRPVHVVIAGSGPEEDALRRQAHGLNGATIHFVGFQTDVARWFAVGDVVALPSFVEAMGHAALEGMACSRPVVASAVGGLTELIENERTGLLVPPGQPDRLAEALSRVLRSPEVASRMGTAGRARFLARFTNEAMVSSWVDCYESAVSAPARA